MRSLSDYQTQFQNACVVQVKPEFVFGQTPAYNTELKAHSKFRIQHTVSPGSYYVTNVYTTETKYLKQRHSLHRLKQANVTGLRRRIPENTWSRSWNFCPTLEVQLNHFIHLTPRLEVLTRACWNGAISLETFIETENPCCAPRIPLIASCYKMVDCQTSFMLFLRSQTFYLRLRNPG